MRGGAQRSDGLFSYVRPDRRTTRHAGYRISQVIRKRIEEANGWLKTGSLLRKTRQCGVARVGWMVTLGAAAYNLTRLPKLLPTG